MDAGIPMYVKPLASMDERKSAITEWIDNGLTPAETDAIQEEMLADDCATPRWYGVVDKNNGMTIATFDVRSVPLESPDYHKSLRIHFAPGLNPQDWGNIGQSPESIDAIITKSVSALFMAFRHLVDQAELTKEHMVKIYCAHPLRLLMFQEFAKALAEEAPTLYAARYYKKWVEIKHL